MVAPPRPSSRTCPSRDEARGLAATPWLQCTTFSTVIIRTRVSYATLQLLYLAELLYISVSSQLCYGQSACHPNISRNDDFISDGNQISKHHPKFRICRR